MRFAAERRESVASPMTSPTKVMAPDPIATSLCIASYLPRATTREKELAAVKISADDVRVIQTEFDVDKKAAERRLRECKGVLEAALRSYIA